MRQTANLFAGPVLALFGVLLFLLVRATDFRDVGLVALVAALLFVLLGVFAAFGWWGSALMRNKARPPWLGWALGGTLGVIGLIICLLIPADREAQFHRQREWERRIDAGE